MKKDIFIDANVASKFTNPQDIEYLRLTNWLLYYDKDNKNNYAYLVVSKKLLVEYYRSSIGAHSSSSIPVIINKLQQEGRLIIISNEQIKKFQIRFFKKKIQNKLRSNREDWEHIPVILLSDRKYALTNDNNLIYDLENFPGFNVLVKKRPEEIPYDK